MTYGKAWKLVKVRIKCKQQAWIHTTITLTWVQIMAVCSSVSGVPDGWVCTFFDNLIGSIVQGKLNQAQVKYFKDF